MKNKKEEIRGFNKKSKLRNRDDIEGTLKDKMKKNKFEDLDFNVMGIVFKLDVIGDDDFEVDVRKLLMIKPSSLHKDAEEIPTRLVQLGVMIGKLKLKAEILEIKRKKKYSRVFSRIRNEKKDSKMSDTAISKLVEDDEEYMELSKQGADLRNNIYMIEQVYWGLKEKSDIIKTLYKNT